MGQSRNQGVEMLVSLSPIKSQNFNWNLILNAAYNKTEVLNLGSDVSNNMITVGTADFSGELRQVVGSQWANFSDLGTCVMLKEDKYLILEMVAH